MTWKQKRNRRAIKIKAKCIKLWEGLVVQTPTILRLILFGEGSKTLIYLKLLLYPNALFFGKKAGKRSTKRKASRIPWWFNEGFEQARVDLYLFTSRSMLLFNRLWQPLGYKIHNCPRISKWKINLKRSQFKVSAAIYLWAEAEEESSENEVPAMALFHPLVNEAIS